MLSWSMVRVNCVVWGKYHPLLGMNVYVLERPLRQAHVSVFVPMVLKNLMEGGVLCVLLVKNKVLMILTVNRYVRHVHQMKFQIQVL